MRKTTSVYPAQSNAWAFSPALGCHVSSIRKRKLCRPSQSLRSSFWELLQPILKWLLRSSHSSWSSLFPHKSPAHKMSYPSHLPPCPIGTSPLPSWVLNRLQPPLDFNLCSKHRGWSPLPRRAPHLLAGSLPLPAAARSACHPPFWLLLKKQIFSSRFPFLGVI